MRVRVSTVVVLACCAALFVWRHPLRWPDEDAIARDDAVLAALSQPVDFQVEQLPLRGALRQLGDACGIAIVWESHLRANNLTAAEWSKLSQRPVSLVAQQLSAQTVLELLLRQARGGLAWAVAEGQLRITVDDPREQSRFVVGRIHPIPVTHLRHAEATSGELAEAVSMGLPSSSFDETGPCRCEALPAGLAVVDTVVMQQRVSRLIDALAQWEQDPTRVDPIPISHPPTPARLRLAATLARCVDVDYDDLSLEQVLDDLRQRLGVPVWIDPDVAAATIGSPPLRLRGRQIPVTSVLGAIADATDLKWIEVHDALLLTDPVDLPTTWQQTWLYPVHDLADNPSQQSALGVLLQQMDTDRTCAWDGDHSGWGVLELSQCLFVTGTSRRHEAIRHALACLRAAASSPTASGVWTDDPESETTLRKLDSLVTLNAQDWPLPDVLAALSEQANVPIVVGASLSLRLIIKEGRVSLRCQQLKLRDALDEILDGDFWQAYPGPGWIVIDHMGNFRIDATHHALRLDGLLLADDQWSRVPGVLTPNGNLSKSDGDFASLVNSMFMNTSSSSPSAAVWENLLLLQGNHEHALAVRQVVDRLRHLPDRQWQYEVTALMGESPSELSGAAIADDESPAVDAAARYAVYDLGRAEAWTSTAGQLSMRYLRHDLGEFYDPFPRQSGGPGANVAQRTGEFAVAGKVGMIVYGDDAGQHYVQQLLTTLDAFQRLPVRAWTDARPWRQTDLPVPAGDPPQTLSAVSFGELRIRQAAWFTAIQATEDQQADTEESLIDWLAGVVTASDALWSETFVQDDTLWYRSATEVAEPIQVEILAALTALDRQFVAYLELPPGDTPRRQVWLTANYETLLSAAPLAERCAAGWIMNHFAADNTLGVPERLARVAKQLAVEQNPFLLDAELRLLSASGQDTAPYLAELAAVLAQGLAPRHQAGYLNVLELAGPGGVPLLLTLNDQHRIHDRERMFKILAKLAAGDEAALRAILESWIDSPPNAEPREISELLEQADPQATITRRLLAAGVADPDPAIRRGWERLSDGLSMLLGDEP